MTDLRPRIAKKRRLLLPVIAGSVGLVVVLGLGFREQVRDIYSVVAGLDYTGGSSETVEFVISKGETGEDVAKKLVSAGITKSLDVTLRKMNLLNPTFFPGTYKIQKQISSQKAIEFLTNPQNILVNRVTIREGLRNKSVFKILSQATDIPVSTFEREAEKLGQFDIPKVATNLEGYLYPATYEFNPGLTAKEILQILVDRTKEQLVADGIAKVDWHRTLTLASIIQSEARLTEDFYKVSRTFQNRLAIGMPLQSDATVNYGVGSEDIYTSNAERNDPNKYNTYLYSGLPIGPIAGAGALAIDAVLHPAEGKWLYFCTVNLKTGETVFSNTYAEHEKAVAQWLKWMRENPGWDD
ncbi:MAG: endolytic transglycosylase MltG [Microbacteriaceae bacterium]|nr:endolytic transglycosylase MltG [Microbacteriaceae bacterium]